MQITEKITKKMWELDVNGQVFIISEEDGHLQIRTSFGGMVIFPKAGNCIFIKEEPTSLEYEQAMEKIIG